jgi:hypothetical protein
MSQVRQFLAATDSRDGSNDGSDVSREARGLGIVLLYAAYEHLLHSLVRGLLEAAVAIRSGNRRLKTGFRVAAVVNQLQSISDSRGGRVRPNTAREVVRTLDESRGCTVDVNWFPDDGTHMKRTQVSSFFDLFDLGDPASILREAWDRLDTIVDERNAIAHGRRRADEVGRQYTRQDLLCLVDLWEQRWLEVAAVIEQRTYDRSFFRSPR